MEKERGINDVERAYSKEVIVIGNPSIGSVFAERCKEENIGVVDAITDSSHNQEENREFTHFLQEMTKETEFIEYTKYEETDVSYKDCQHRKNYSKKRNKPSEESLRATSRKKRKKKGKKTHRK